MKFLCNIYKSSKKNETYLYVDHRIDLKRVPESLLEVFGKPIKVTTLLLTENRTLARALSGDVIKAIHAQGYYLQMPPKKENYLLDLYKDTSSKYNVNDPSSSIH